MERVGKGYILYVLGDRVRVDIAGTFGNPGKNDNGRRVGDFCGERRL